MIPIVEMVLASNLLNEQNQSNLFNSYKKYLEKENRMNKYFEKELLPSFEKLFKESLKKEREK